VKSIYVSRFTFYVSRFTLVGTNHGDKVNFALLRFLWCSVWESDILLARVDTLFFLCLKERYADAVGVYFAVLGRVSIVVDKPFGVVRSAEPEPAQHHRDPRR
jgi:hypothetical protein